MSLFRKKKQKKQITKPVAVGVHQVTGDYNGIEFLQNADQKYVDSLFWFAKRYGFSEFSYDDVTYTLQRKKDITYEVQTKDDEDVEFVREFH
ncbi:MAG: hypothetical protein V1838_05815 [Patescibacteria group bacterium]